MKPTGVVRKVDQLGRIVLPKSLRKLYEMNVGDPIEIFVQGEHIVLEKYKPRCSFCGSDEQVKEYNNRTICFECLEEVKTLFS